MKILLGTAAAAHRAELEQAEHEVIDWRPNAAVDDDAELIVVSGLAGIEAARRLPVHILAIVTADELDELGRLDGRLTSFAVEPLATGEIAARVRRIATLPSYAQRELHRLLSLAVENTSDVVEITDPNAVLRFVNPAFERTLGVSRDEAIGKTPAQLVRSDAHTPEFFRDLDATLSRGDAWSGTLISRSRTGRKVHLDTTITPIADEDGNITHHLAVKRDYTEQIHRQAALMEANRALEQARDTALAASQAKSEFVANMSHELRTPLNAIIGYSEMLMEDAEDAGQTQTLKDLERIRTAGSHLLALINDVLDISKIEASRVELTPQTFAVTELVEAVTDTARPLADKNDNELVVQCPDDLGSMYADRMRLQQVLFNLLSNACKFTKQGRVTLSLRRAGSAGDPTLELQVSDTGIGISPEQQKKLFQPFVQADSSTTREFGGTGLGLVISKRLVEMMGGSIELDSERGRGATFTVHVPFISYESTDQLPAARAVGNGPLILLIDDDEDVRDQFTRLLAARGFRVLVAGSGPQGLELAKLTKPAAIVLDVKMPNMSGWDVLSQLKLSDRTADIPVIMLTVLHEQEIGRALGAVDYLVKPLDTDKLVETLQRHVKAGAKVLVVEDDEPTREIIRRTLARAGHTVTEAENGKVALERLPGDAPNIVVLDLMMPVMDGLTFLHHLRADERYEDLPVIVATAQVLSDSERQLLAKTAQKVIEKKAHSRSQLLKMITDQIENMFSA